MEVGIADLPQSVLQTYRSEWGCKHVVRCEMPLCVVG